MAIALGGLGSSLTHRNVAVRATSAWLIGLVALIGAWLVSYRWMPEGVVGFTLAAQLPLESLRQQASLTAGIFLWNLAVGGTALAVSSCFRLGRVPLAALARPLLAGTTALARGGRAAARCAPAADVERRHRGRPDRRGAWLARSRC